MNKASIKIETIDITESLRTVLNEKEKLLLRLMSELPNQYKAIAFATSMGAEDMVITYVLNKIKSPIEIFTLDTGRLHQETYDLIAEVNQSYTTQIKVYYPSSNDVENYVSQYGINDFYNSLESRKECCRVRKIEPLKRALNGKDAWISGIRSEQSITRSDTKLIDKDSTYNLDKISPLLDWTENEVWAYIELNDIPYNKLHDHFFPSIGCEPCTRAISIGEDVRAGRWWWENPEHKECGLHKK